MTRYLFSTPVLTSCGQWRFEGPLDLDQARALAQGAVSAIDHASTARYLSARVGLPVRSTRLLVRMQPGDQALVLRLLQRLPEGTVLGADTVETVLAPARIARRSYTRRSHRTTSQETA